MNPTQDPSTMNISRLKQAFKQGRAISTDELRGFYRGQPAGPWWFRLGSGPTLALSGFGGWLGKEFVGQGRATNRFQQGSDTVSRFPMTLNRARSRVDGQDTLVLNYPSDARAPWCWVIDELRQLPDGRILGMTFVNAPLIKHMVFPFVLQSSQGAEAADPQRVTPRQ